MTASTSRKIKVLIVDDSAIVRQLLSRFLSMDAEIEVVGAAADAFIAKDLIEKHRPDVMTLDIEMPKMDGLTFLERLMPQYPMPVVIVSSLTEKGGAITLKALQLGAVDFVTKPSARDPGGLGSVVNELCDKIKVAAGVDVKHLKRADYHKPAKCVPQAIGNHTKLIAIGASTGGTEAIRLILRTLPPEVPGIVVVQHMPPGFTALYAKDLNGVADIEVVEGRTGEKVAPGKAIIAPGGQQMRIRPTLRGGYDVECYPGVKVSGHSPSVDVLFDSVAQVVGRYATGILLTGMGRDGAEGLAKMRENGAYTLAQDEKSCVVFGMPKVAIELGAVMHVVPLEEIAGHLLWHLKKGAA